MAIIVIHRGYTVMGERFCLYKNVSAFYKIEEKDVL